MQVVQDKQAELEQYSRKRSALGQAYVDIGQGEPIVLVHGVGMRLEAWGPQISSLAQTNRVIAVDLPGHGESSSIAPGSTLADFVQWLEDFLEALSLDQVNLVGHSMGALISGGLGVTAPRRIKRLALLNGVFKRDAASRLAIVTRADSILSKGIDIEGPLQRWFGNDHNFSKVRGDVHRWLAAMDVESYATAYQAFARGDATYADQFRTITAPSLFLTGADDPNSTAAMSQSMANIVQDGEACIIAGQRHMMNLTAPEEVTMHLWAWLKR